ncbi:hypothetical protein TNCV_2846871 [Trichonephila clavipes]|nr:hypothetical protein TNCV_2846871 [Trichonephila clavipes]
MILLKAQWSSVGVSCFHTTGPGSIPGLGKVYSAFHPYCSGLINEYQKKSLLGDLNTGDLASDGPPDRDMCSCTSAPNGHIYWDRHSRPWPSEAVAPLSLSFMILLRQS